MIDPTTLFGSVAIILALVELVKRTIPDLDKRWLPLIGVVVGVAFNLALGYNQHVSLFAAGLTGLTAGLAASGLFSSGKATIGR